VISPYEGNRDDPDFFAKRLAALCQQSDEIAETFLRDYATGELAGQTMRDSFDLWAADNLCGDVELTVAERGLLLYHVAHLKTGERRIHWANAHREDVFSGSFNPREAPIAADRFERGGDLRQGESEPTEDYLRRLSVAFGHSLTSPAARVVTRDARLPYKEKEDDDEPQTPRPGNAVQ